MRLKNQLNIVLISVLAPLMTILLLTGCCSNGEKEKIDNLLKALEDRTSQLDEIAEVIDTEYQICQKEYINIKKNDDPENFERIINESGYYKNKLKELSEFRKKLQKQIDDKDQQVTDKGDKIKELEALIDRAENWKIEAENLKIEAKKYRKEINDLKIQLKNSKQDYEAKTRELVNKEKKLEKVKEAHEIKTTVEYE